MSEDPASPSKRARVRAVRRARRDGRAALREASFDALAAGFTPAQIAEARRVSVAAVRREIDRALDERRLDAPERYVHLQVARLTKALRLADARIDGGELKAITPLMAIVAALDRYHGLGSTRATGPAPAAPPRALPAPPLALTHNPEPLDGEALKDAEPDETPE